MAFKMKGFSAFTKPTDPPKGEKKEKKDKKQNVESLKEKLFNMENPNSSEGKKLQATLRNLGEDLSSGNYDEID
jgi:hypothetical protein|tara:strand:+ start:3197 stop:3418 length:222 start_codon:yes stop_codon:yes gene_type:complete